MTLRAVAMGWKWGVGRQKSRAWYPLAEAVVRPTLKVELQALAAKDRVEGRRKLRMPVPKQELQPRTL